MQANRSVVLEVVELPCVIVMILYLVISMVSDFLDTTVVAMTLRTIPRMARAVHDNTYWLSSWVSRRFATQKGRGLAK